jgi:osmotically-inducible protein OsmY
MNGKSPQVTVRDRVATLRGTAEDLGEKLAAEDDAWNVAGVRDIVDELEIPAPAADADLALAVTDALKAELPTETWNRLAATVKKGSVVIAGNVSSSYERWQARDIVSRIKGVTGIDNRVRVAPMLEGTRQAGLTDQEIRDRTLLVLKWDPLLGAGDEIKVSVVNGVATITGKVLSPVRALQAARDAFDAGVHGVKSDLVIGERPLTRIAIQRGKGASGILTTGGSEMTTYTAPPADSYPSFREPQS